MFYAIYSKLLATYNSQNWKVDCSGVSFKALMAASCIVVFAYLSTEMVDLAKSFNGMMQLYVSRYGVKAVGCLAGFGLNILNGLVPLSFCRACITERILRSTRNKNKLSLTILLHTAHHTDSSSRDSWCFYGSCGH
jgi:hypothetical protein